MRTAGGSSAKSKTRLGPHRTGGKARGLAGWRFPGLAVGPSLSGRRRPFCGRDRQAIPWQRVAPVNGVRRGLQRRPEYPPPPLAHEAGERTGRVYNLTGSFCQGVSRKDAKRVGLVARRESFAKADFSDMTTKLLSAVWRETPTCRRSVNCASLVYEAITTNQCRAAGTLSPI